MDNEPHSKEIKNNFGVIEIREVSLGDNKIHICTVNDRDGSRVSLPIIRPDKLIQLGGLNQIILKDFSPEESNYFNQALERLPYLLAVHVTFNRDPRPNLEDFPLPVDHPTPVVGVDGPPHSGKTALLLALAVYDPDDDYGVRDFDPFSRQKFSGCLEKLKSQVPSDINQAKPQDVMEKCAQIYVEANNTPFSEDNSQITLKSKLDQLLEEYKFPKDKVCYILDQPGIDENTKRYDAFHLLSAAVPPIDLSEPISKIMPLNKLTTTPMSKRLGTAGAYLLYLRSKVFPTRGSDSKQIDLLDQALWIHNWIQSKLSTKQPNLVQ